MNRLKKIYAVEDDEDIREIVLYALQSGGFDASGFENGADFFAAMEHEPPAMVLLDIMLPDGDGLSILKRLRASHRPGVPVILLTAKGSEFDKVKGLDLGADDYITKPFSVMELISRVNAVLRRTVSMDAESVTYREIHLDKARRVVKVSGREVVLTFKEFELLAYLMANAGIALSRNRILEAVWGYDFEGESRSMDMHIRTLRQKLGTAGAYIKTIRNVGYKIGE